MSGSPLQDLLKGNIDFEGQKLADSIVRNGLITSTIVSLLVGFANQSLRLTFLIIGVSTFGLLLVVVPSWSVYNQHPVKWLPCLQSEDETKKFK